MRARLVLPSILIALAASPSVAAEVDLPRYPSISPDGSRIVFSWRGDLWMVGSTGGAATRLTSHPGTEMRSAWSRDGDRIAFESDRSGWLNLYTMKSDGSEIAQVTFADSHCILSSWGPQDETLTFQAYRDGSDVYREPRPYQVPSTGGAITRVHDAFGREPKPRRDGRMLLFTRGGSSWARRHYRGSASRDVWVQDTAAGSFRQLTTWEGNDGLTRWHGDQHVVYLSDRELDAVNVWRMPLDDGGASAKRLTSFSDVDVQWMDVAADSDIAVLHAWDTLYTLDLSDSGAEPRALTITAPQDEGDRTFLRNVSASVKEAALHPSGDVMAYVAFGEIFVRSTKDDTPTVRVTTDQAHDRDIAWSPDGLTLYFVSDRNGVDGIYAATVATTRGDIEKAYKEAIEPPKPEPEPAPKTDAETTSPPGDDTGDDSGDSSETGDPEAASDTPAEGSEEPEPADGAADTSEEGTEQAGADEDLPDPKRWADALAFDIAPVIVGEASARVPTPSPDGKSLAYRHGLGSIVVRLLEDASEVTLLDGWDPWISFTWSPDSRHLAWSVNDRNFNADVWIARADGSEPAVNVSRHPDNDFNPSFSADGKMLAFSSERYDEQYDLYVVFLDRKLETLSALERTEYFEATSKAAKALKPLPVAKPKPEKETEPKEDTGPEKKEGDAAQDGEAAEGAEKPEAATDKAEEEPEPLDLADAYLRLRRVTSTPEHEVAAVITPDGKRIVYGRGNELRSIGWDGKDDKRLRSSGSIQHLSVKGDKVVWVGGGRAGVVGTAGGGDKTHDISATLELEYVAFADQKFREAMRHLGQIFYHPEMKGLDWPGLTERYAELAVRARTTSEFDDIANRMLGELNASHLGITSPGGPAAATRRAIGRLGVQLQPGADGWRVTRVLPETPAELGTMRLEVDDVITAIDGLPLDLSTDLDVHLRGKVDMDVLLDVRRPVPPAESSAAIDSSETTPSGPLELQMLVRTISSGRERQLGYEQWTLRNAARVHEWSDGRIGYLHIRGMNRTALRDFERDLFAAADGRDALLVDVRNNGGGSTADLVLASIMVQPHAYTVPRGADPSMTEGYPQDRLYIQRFVGPMNMLCNEKSFSNAEIVSHAFKTLERGTLVGEETYGGVISTGSHTLIDGTRIRIPFRGWYLPDGTDMENNGATPDIRVPRTPAGEEADDDAQLRAAVEDLLKRL